MFSGYSSKKPRKVDNLRLIRSAVKRIQEEGGEGNFAVFIANLEKNYFIQIAGGRGQTELFGEAVSNKFLYPRDALDDNRLAQLRGLGWNTPSTRPGSPINFWLNLPARDEGDRQQIALQVIDTLVTVYGFDLEKPLTVDLVLE